MKSRPIHCGVRYHSSCQLMGTSRISKKRPANSQGGREPKKRQQEVSKRSVPVTKVVQEAVASSDDELEVAEENENESENAMEIDTPAPVKSGTSSGRFFFFWLVASQGA
jgi:hypothetical protein